MTNQLKTILLLGVLSAVLIGLGGMLGPGFLWGAVGISAVLNIGGWLWSDRLVLRMHGAVEVTPQEAPALHRMVAELADRAGLPMPRVCVIPSDQPNAFATGRTPRHGVVAVTEGLLRLLTPRELRGVLAHELAHIQNRDTLIATLAAVMASAIGWLGHMVGFATAPASPGEGEESPAGGGLLWALLAPLGATFVQLGISRSREYLADARGAAIAGDPEGLASALEKLDALAHHVEPEAAPQPATASLFIVNPLAGAARLFQLFSTHPPIAERVRRLRAMADHDFLWAA